MSSGFTKLFNSIITSSIWSEDDKVRLMWITMLASTDANGYVTGSIPGMAAIARMSLQEAEQSIAALCSPDPYSRSKELEGRRLIEADGGWLIVNYGKYRQRRDPEKRREQNREAKRRQREKKSGCQQDVSQCQPKSAQAEAEAEAEAEAIKKERSQRKFSPPTSKEVEEYARSIEFLIDGEKFVSHYAANGWMRGKTKMRDWRAAVRYWKTTEKENNGYGSGKTREAEPVGEFIR